jgi:hypothetical protein
MMGMGIARVTADRDGDMDGVPSKSSCQRTDKEH